MKNEIAAFVARCDNCCRVKAVHMKVGLVQPLPIPRWKWEEVWTLSLHFQLLSRVMTQFG